MFGGYLKDFHFNSFRLNSQEVSLGQCILCTEVSWTMNFNFIKMILKCILPGCLQGQVVTEAGVMQKF